MLTEDSTRYFPGNLNARQLSEEAVDIIEKVARGQELSEQELDVLLNPTEVAAVLSVKYRRPVNHRYVRTLGRPVPSRTSDHITPARLTYDKVAGTAYLYKTRKVLAVALRESLERPATEEEVGNETTTAQ
jgi:hypothetical protein